MRILTLTLLLLLGSLAGAAEPDPVLEGVVLDRDRNPVIAAEVALHATYGVLRTVTTGRDGRFRFTGALLEEATHLVVDRLGFLPSHQSLSGDPEWIEIVLEPDPVRLRALNVEADQEICERRENAQARQLWEAASRRHQRVPDTVGMATYLLAATTVVAEDGVGASGAGELERGQRGSAPLLRFGWLRRIDREGYAFRVRRTGPKGSYDSWSYAPLEAELAFHFVGPSFGRLHRFHFPSGERESVVVFCPREPERPGIEGQLHFAADTTLTKVEWLFRTPEPSERSGGRVYFPPNAGGGSANALAPYLVPSEGLVWRQQPDGTFLQRYQRYEGWIFAPGDSVPFLPRRRP